MTISKTDFLERFLSVPISVNNLYGDPFLQTDNTLQKLAALESSSHKGPVALITKSEVPLDILEKLKSMDLNIVVLVSVSGLEGTIEKTNGERVNTLERCVSIGLPCVAYVRPFVPGKNTNEEDIRNIFCKIRDSGCKICVISGLRGNDEILTMSGISEEEKKDWSYRVKIIPKYVRENIEKYSHDLTVFERTSCAVSYVLGYDYSFNPYYFSPQLAKCGKCPLKDTCFEKRRDFHADDSDIEFLDMLGYNATREYPGTDAMCRTKPEKRTECVSCCTGCYFVPRDHIDISPAFDVCLGDVSLCRHLCSGILVNHPGTYDHGESDIAVPNNPMLKEFGIYMLNTWWSWSRNMSACYGCSYCIVPAYKNQNREYGSLPIETGEGIWKKIQRQNRM